MDSLACILLSAESYLRIIAVMTRAVHTVPLDDFA